MIEASHVNQVQAATGAGDAPGSSTFNSRAEVVMGDRRPSAPMKRVEGLIAGLRGITNRN